jgi:hypothetical protein
MKQLAIQEYLRSGKTLTDLKQEYHIDCIVNDELDLVVFNYSPLTPLNTEIGKEARALFLQLKNWDVVGKSIGGFLDIHNKDISSTLNTFNWAKAKAYNKYDGCLVVLYYYKDEWRIGTRFSTDGKCNVFSPNSGESNLQWIDVFKNTLVEYGMQWEDFISLLNEHKYYTFELCTPWNRNTVIYPNSLIKLLAVVDSLTLLEDNINESKLKVFEPEFEIVNSLEDVYSLISKNDNPLENEGYIVVDKSFNRIKVKNLKYEELNFTSYSTDDFKSLKRYANDISMMASVLDYYCVVCNPSPGFGPPTNSCVSVPFGETLYYPPEQNCVTTKVLSCGNCPGYIPPEGEGAGPASIQSTQACSTSWNPKTDSFSKNQNTTNLLKDFVSFIGWFNNKYLEYKSTGNVLVKELLVSIWSYAFDELSKGKGIGDIINSSSEVDQVKALELYQLIVQDN